MTPHLLKHTAATGDIKAQPYSLQLILRHTFYHALLVIALLLNTQCQPLVADEIYTDSANLKPNVVLITPQSFKLPAGEQTLIPDTGQERSQQYVAIVNNAHNDRDDQILRLKYQELALQLRDASSPSSGQLYYEHIFSYFQPGKQHLLVPINFDQVSLDRNQLLHQQNYAGALTNSYSRSTRRPTQVIVSIRPRQVDSTAKGDIIEFIRSAPIPVEHVPSGDGRRSFGVVQTDKPVYKVEDLVRIRAFALNENLRPATKEEIRLQIKNPRKMVVEEVKFPTSFGDNPREPMFFDHTFSFPSEPILGTWSVHLLHPDAVANDSASFEVKEYTLPTYEIEFDSPKYILPNAQSITGSITAKYHYGKPVQGKAQFKFGVKETKYSKPRYIARSSIKTVDPITGRVEYKIPAERFKETEWFPAIAGSRFVVEANVVESSTGHREVSQDSSCIFLTHAYRISFDDSIVDFKPGMSQQLIVKLYESQTERAAPAGIPLTAEYRDQNSSLVVLHDTSEKQEQPRGFLDEIAITDASGRATFNIGPLPDNITVLQVQLKWFNTSSANNSHSKLDPMLELAKGTHTLHKHDSINGWISIMNKSVTHLNVGDQFISDTLIRDAIVIRKKIYYIILSKGNIMSVNTLNSEGFIQFSVDNSMMPSIRLVLFALSHDSVGLLSDSMTIEVGQDLSCGMHIDFQPDGLKQLSVSDKSITVRPDTKGKLEIKARIGDSISLIGVDSAVYAVNNRSRLESSRIFQRIKRLDTGCGFGGGKNHLDVFHNAGLMLFKDQTSIDPSDNPMKYIGSSCMTIMNQLKHLEDMELGYSRPMFSAATQLGRLRGLEMLNSRHRTYGSSLRGSRIKRDVEVDSILRRYKDPLHRSCCKLGTMEDLPQRRNCSIRARIVERFMHQAEHKSCSTVYFDCCRAVFNQQLLLGSMVNTRDEGEPVVERVLASKQPLQYAETSSLGSVGHLDRMESLTLLRKDFRETWLFDVTEANQDGSASLDVKLPHSITGWSISALALNFRHPICLTRPFELATFQEIFLQVSMPSKVIQGEQIDLVVTIFNYSPKNQEVLVYTIGVDGICSDAEPNERSERRRVLLEKLSSQSVIFPMIPLKVGKFPVRVHAITPHDGINDIVEQDLQVVARLVTDEFTFSIDPMSHQRPSKRAIQTGIFLDEIDSSRGLQLCRFNIDSSIEEWLPKINLIGSSKQSSGLDSDILKSSSDVHTNETIEDDYFKTFDKNMLSELNLVDPSQLASTDQLVQPTIPKPIKYNAVLRTRRHASLFDDLQSKRNNLTSTLEDWTTRVVSSVKSRLPAWLAPKPTQQASTTDKNDQEDVSIAQPDAPRRTNTTRRSPQSLQVPLITQPTGIPSDAKLNPLSLQLSITSNETANNSSISNSLEQQYSSPVANSRKLILLLRVCVHHMSSRRDSEMSVIEVGILSGFKPNEADLKEIVKDVGTPATKYELSPDKSLVVIYLQYIPYSGPYCLQFRMIRDSMVYNLQSGYIRAYEYYSPTYSCANFYTPARQTDLISTKCDDFGSVCQCASRSLCPATNKLLDLGEIHSVNVTRARAQFIDLVCSDRYDFVSLVRLKNVRNLEARKIFKLNVKVKSDLKGNLTKLIEAQARQKAHTASLGLRKSQPSTAMTTTNSDAFRPEEITVDEDDSSLDTLPIIVDSGCIRNDSLLIHLAHPNQWKQGGELMILFGKYNQIEKRYFRSSTKLDGASSNRNAALVASASLMPKPKPTVLSSRPEDKEPPNMDEQVLDAQVKALGAIDDAQQLKYSLIMSLEKDSILHDLTYQAKSEPRETINNLILWVELRARREKWNCAKGHLTS